MSAEDNSSADQADIGEALVAALGFEPTEGRKIGKKAAAVAADAADTIEVDAPTDAPLLDEPLSVVSPESQAAALKDNTKSSGSKASGSKSGSGNGSGQARSGGQSKKQRNRNRNRNRNRAQNGQQKAGSGQSGSGSNAGSGSGSETEAAKAKVSDAVDDLKAAAKPAVSTADGVKQDGGAGSSQPADAKSGSSKSSAVGDGAVGDGAAKSGGGAKSGQSGAAKAAATNEAPQAKQNAKQSSGDQAKAGSGSGAAAKSTGSSAGSDGSSKASDASASTKSSGGPSKKAAAAGAAAAAAGGAAAGKAKGAADKIAEAAKAEVITGDEPPMAAKAAVTGDIQTVTTEANQLPPPPSAGDVIKVDGAGAPMGDAVAAAAPQKAGGRAERMAHAAKAKVETRVDVPPDSPPLVDSPPLKPAVAPNEQADIVAPGAASPAVAPAPQMEAVNKSGTDLSSVRNLLRRKRKVQARKVRRVVRHIDPWSVLTFSVLFHLCVFAALLLASVLVWNAAEAAGTIENLETFILELGDYDTFEIKGDEIFRAAVAIAGVLTLASSVMLVLLTVVFNLISDLVGGIRLTVIEEETVRVRRRKKSK